MMNGVNIGMGSGGAHVPGPGAVPMPGNYGMMRGAVLPNDPVGRFNRRMDTYRQHHSEVVNHYEFVHDETAEAQRQQKALLHQRWLESRAKMASGKAKTRGEGGIPAIQPTAATGAVLNTPTPTSKLKRKATSDISTVPHKTSTSLQHQQQQQPVNIGGCTTQTFSFPSNQSSHQTSQQQQQQEHNKPNNQSKPGSDSSFDQKQQQQQQFCNNVSLNINVNANLNRNPSEIKLTFSSTVNTSVGPGGNTATPGGDVGDLKKEPCDDFVGHGQSQQAGVDPTSADCIPDFDDITDEFSEFLNKIDDDGEFPPEFLHDLNQGEMDGMGGTAGMGGPMGGPASMGGPVGDSSGMGGGFSMSSSTTTSTSVCVGVDGKTSIDMLSSMSQSVALSMSSSKPGTEAVTSSYQNYSCTDINPMNSATRPLTHFTKSPSVGDMGPPQGLLGGGDTGPAAETLKLIAAQTAARARTQEGMYAAGASCGLPDASGYGYPSTACYPGSQGYMGMGDRGTASHQGMRMPVDPTHMAYRPHMRAGGMRPYSAQTLGGGGGMMDDRMMYSASQSQQMRMQMMEGQQQRMKMMQSQQIAMQAAGRAAGSFSMSQQQSFSMAASRDMMPGTAAEKSMYPADPYSATPGAYGARTNPPDYATARFGAPVAGGMGEMMAGRRMGTPGAGGMMMNSGDMRRAVGMYPPGHEMLVKSEKMAGGTTMMMMGQNGKQMTGRQAMMLNRMGSVGVGGVAGVGGPAGGYPQMHPQMMNGVGMMGGGVGFDQMSANPASRIMRSNSDWSAGKMTDMSQGRGGGGMMWGGYEGGMAGAAGGQMARSWSYPDASSTAMIPPAPTGATGSQMQMVSRGAGNMEVQQQQRQYATMHYGAPGAMVANASQQQQQQQGSNVNQTTVSNPEFIQTDFTAGSSSSFFDSTTSTTSQQSSSVDLSFIDDIIH